jgi:excisionase family DNA binding protein
MDKPKENNHQRLLLKVTEAAEMLGLSRSKTYELLQNGLPFVMIGRCKRIPVIGLRKWVEEQEGKGDRVIS